MAALHALLFAVVFGGFTGDYVKLGLFLAGVVARRCW